MRQLVSTRVRLLVATLLLATSGHAADGDVAGTPSDAGQRPRDVRTVLVATGIEIREFDTQGLVHFLQCDEVYVRPRRMMFFNMRNVNEVYLRNARVKLFLRGDEPPEADLLDLNDERLTPGGNLRGAGTYGRITRTVVDGVLANIYADKHLKVIVRARQGSREVTQSMPELIWVTLSGPVRQIAARRVVWDKVKREFRIPGKYRLRTAKGIQEGQSVRANLDLELSPL